ncbi:heme ABC transporter ATP-binding protein/permease CydC [Shewanella fidelis]|uniref:Glutathione/L-cysteine transport system ATP-binding/permease protein CydC n=1 Tax=Shewanella fidelis TaxID=173509 RepID=A0AAW8NGF0_9GAMM|nr:cysteine/glutathione ABC transporter ATP-binding protein/permease CydC [Shewanella fidelis]MDR8522428.1 cysteine/glutathione ABC transporter ATP-binding protein/permease CydC [Shewanella fidelis]MDW4813038.1 cysteine/glutathione ABC transporter ATP-binding protein/permease CydC [Shewanella fidelis]MDW4816703.1 cysteine/glutathione ABC transporter ATP-binding protein/permease CydC [Shewanella fidelis]MDW4821045.1 cysteine/glutathione ABC transporter ATP-binding protein/permease CydC [Shewanel
MKALFPYIKRFKSQWFMMFIGLFLSVTTLMAGIGLLSLSGWFLSATAVAGLTVLTAQTFNYFTPAGGVRFLSIVRTASRYGERLATHEATFSLLTDLRCWVWNKLLPLSAKNLQGVRQGDLLNRLVADIDTLDHLYLRLITPLAASLLMTLALYFFVGHFDPELAGILCSVLLAIWVLLPTTFYFLGRKPGMAQLETKRVLRVQLLEYIQGQAELTLFGAQQAYRARLEQAQTAMITSQNAMNRVTALSQACLILCHGFAVLLMLYLAASGVGTAVPPGPRLAMIVFLTMATIEMMMPLAGAFQHLSACTAAATRLNEVVEQTPSVTFANDPCSDVTAGKISFSNIDFAYHEQHQVLNGLNLEIAAGQKVALLGQTGCGKSSLLSLLTREWLPTQGKVSIDDKDAGLYSEQQLRQSMSVVSQRIYLFSGTLRDNLALAITGFTRKDDDKLIAVLNKVGLESLLQGDKPLDTWLGEGGRQLSGGEQRRIGVARALLRDAPILLLDEPTEGLDKRTEREILRLLFEFATDKTMLMISHRLTAMNKMDCIYLMEQGVIRVSGSHTDLLANDSYYASLFKRLG